MKKEQAFDLSVLLHGTTLPPPSTDFVTARLIVDCHCHLGEGCIFDDQRHAVLWTDILGQKFHRLQLNYSEPTKVVFYTYDLPQKLGSFGMLLDQSSSASSTSDADTTLPLLCAFEDGFQLYDMERQQPLSQVSQGEDVNPDKGTSRLNDGRVEPGGMRFVAGGYFGNQEGTKMKVFSCQQQAAPDTTNGQPPMLVHTPIIDNIECANSICWSLDATSMYFADSPTKNIVRYKYDAATGTVSEPHLLHQQQVCDFSVPDGSCVDSEGFLWNAVWRASAGPGMVQRIDPVSGRVVFTVHMPDATSRVTCCCFGGQDLDILFITTAISSTETDSIDTKKEPHAGGLYAVRLPFRGLPEARLKFKV